MKSINIMPTQMLVFIYSWLLVLNNMLSFTASTSIASPTGLNDVLTYLQREQLSTASAQHNILTFLSSKGIQIDAQPEKHAESSSSTSLPSDDYSLTHHASVDRALRERTRISTENNQIDCRVTLDRAEIGSKCVAPCGCTGSQQWVQFSVLNKLRRKDPTQWQVCQTCRQPFRYDLFVAHAGIRANLLGLALDHLILARVGVLMLVAAIMQAMHASLLIKRFLVSKWLWNLYPRWSKFTKLPFPIKLWLGRLGLLFVFENYVRFEKNVIVNYLADLETRMIEEKLPSYES